MDIMERGWARFVPSDNERCSFRCPYALLVFVEEGTEYGTDDGVGATVGGVGYVEIIA